jgi:hypothetical protein
LILRFLAHLSFNNNFDGHPASLWLFGLITTVTLGRSITHIFLPDYGEVALLAGFSAEHFRILSLKPCSDLRLLTLRQKSNRLRLLAQMIV